MDLTTAQEHLAYWLAADQRASMGQSLGKADRQATQYTPQQIRSQITYWQSVVDALNSTAAGGSSKASIACWNNCS